MERIIRPAPDGDTPDRPTSRRRCALCPAGTLITVYTVVCQTHDQAGPELTSRPEAGELVDDEEWSRFPRENERCDLRLSHE